MEGMDAPHNAKQKNTILIQNYDDFIRDYSHFVNGQAVGNRGCILIKIENLRFVQSIFGIDCLDTIRQSIEAQMISICQQCECNLAIYNTQNSNFVILCAPMIRLFVFEQFEIFCLLLTRIAFDIPSDWRPNHHSFALDDCPKQLIGADNEFYGISPSEEIEGKSKKNKLQKNNDKKEKKRTKFLAKSLSKIKKNIQKSKAVNVVSFDDNAASASEDSKEENDENFNVLNVPMPKSKLIEQVFVSVCGVFGEQKCEFYEECDRLQNKLNYKRKRPLKILDSASKVRDFCFIQQM